MKGRQCYLFGNLLVKLQSSWILMLVQCFILRKYLIIYNILAVSGVLLSRIAGFITTTNQQLSGAGGPAGFMKQKNHKKVHTSMSQYILVCTSVEKSMYLHILWYTVIYCYIPSYTVIYRHILQKVYTSIYQYVLSWKSYTSAYRYILFVKIRKKYIPVYTGIYFWPVSYTVIYHSIVCTGMYRYVLPVHTMVRDSRWRWELELNSKSWPTWSFGEIVRMMILQ